MQETNKNTREEEQMIINQVIRDYRLAFPCPYCSGEINDEHFGEEQKIFKWLSDRTKSIFEKQFNLYRENYHQIWLRRMEEERKWEDFPDVQKLKKNNEEKNQEIARLNSSEYIEKLDRVRRLNEEIKLREEKIVKLQSSEYIENLDRVRKLSEENNELRGQVQLLMIKSRIVKRKGEDFEKYISEELHRVFDDRDRISKINQTQTGKKADFFQEILTETEPKKVVGKIIYEAKDTEKWSNDWIYKLEKDMNNYKADFGIIIAACENGESLRCLDSRKKIYVSDDTNFVYIAKIMRDSLIQRYSLLEKANDDDKEKRIKNFEEWISNKLPQFLSRLEKELNDLNTNTNKISRAAENLKDLEKSIRKIVLEEINMELKNL